MTSGVILTDAELALIRTDIGAILRDQSCDIQRNVGTVDAWGHKSVVWQDHLLNVPCKLTTMSGREVSGPDINVEKTSHYLDIAFGTDVLNTDRISIVRNQLGDIILRDMRVTSVLIRSTHTLVYGEAYRG